MSELVDNKKLQELEKEVKREYLEGLDELRKVKQVKMQVDKKKNVISKLTSIIAIAAISSSIAICNQINKDLEDDIIEIVERYSEDINGYNDKVLNLAMRVMKNTDNDLERVMGVFYEVWDMTMYGQPEEKFRGFEGLNISKNGIGDYKSITAFTEDILKEMGYDAKQIEVYIEANGKLNIPNINRRCEDNGIQIKQNDDILGVNHTMIMVDGLCVSDQIWNNIIIDPTNLMVGMLNKDKTITMYDNENVKCVYRNLATEMKNSNKPYSMDNYMKILCNEVDLGYKYYLNKQNIMSEDTLEEELNMYNKQKELRRYKNIENKDVEIIEF